MSFTSATPFLPGRSGLVRCPTCDLPAIAEYGFHLPSTDGPIEHLRISCIGRHGYLLLADQVSHLSLCDDLEMGAVRDEPV